MVAAGTTLRYNDAVFSPSNPVAWRALGARLRHPRSLLAAGFIFTALFVISCSTLGRRLAPPPEIPGATFTGNNSCVDCHVNYTRGFAASPHGRMHVELAKMAGGTGCESCHGPGSKHIAVGGGRGKFIVNPGRDAQACYSCHLEIQTDFQLPHHHPVNEGKMNCVQCHDPHGPDIMKPAGGLAMARQNEQCASCHREQTRRFVFEHAALREGCVTCHAPHGSMNRKMLTQPDPNLCLRCHAQVASPGVRRGDIVIGKVNHTTFMQRGTCWTSGCHTAVHGSNVDPYLRY